MEYVAIKIMNVHQFRLCLPFPEMNDESLIMQTRLQCFILAKREINIMKKRRGKNLFIVNKYAVLGSVI